MTEKYEITGKETAFFFKLARELHKKGKLEKVIVKLEKKKDKKK